MRSTRSMSRLAFCFTASVAVVSTAAAIGPPKYDLAVIGGFPQSPAWGPISMSQGLNDSGRVVGYGTITPSGTSGLSWHQGSLVNLGMPSGFDRSFGNRVNNAGQIVGGALRSDGSASAPLQWVDGVMTNLGTLGGTQGAALGINDSGRIVGYSSLPGDVATRAFSWQNGTMSALTVPTWANQTIAFDVSDAGHIVGHASNAVTTRPVMWYGGVLTELPVPSTARSGSAVAVNEYGEATGTYELSSGLFVGALWRAGLRTDLGFLGETQYTLPADINDLGQIVGTAAGTSPGHTGFLWQEGTIYDLRSLLSESFLGYQITSARGINSSGQIAAVAMIGGRETAVLLTPVPAPGAWAILMAAGLVGMRRRR